MKLQLPKLLEYCSFSDVCSVSQFLLSVAWAVGFDAMAVGGPALLNHMNPLVMLHHLRHLLLVHWRTNSGQINSENIWIVPDLQWGPVLHECETHLGLPHPPGPWPLVPFSFTFCSSAMPYIDVLQEKLPRKTQKILFRMFGHKIHGALFGQTVLNDSKGSSDHVYQTVSRADLAGSWSMK